MAVVREARAPMCASAAGKTSPDAASDTRRKFLEKQTMLSGPVTESAGCSLFPAVPQPGPESSRELCTSRRAVCAGAAADEQRPVIARRVSAEAAAAPWPVPASDRAQPAATALRTCDAQHSTAVTSVPECSQAGSAS